MDINGNPILDTDIIDDVRKKTINIVEFPVEGISTTFNGDVITNQTTFINNQELVSKLYVDNAITASVSAAETNTGVKTGGVISLNGTPNTSNLFDISAGTGIIYDEVTGTATQVSWNAKIGEDESPYTGILTYISLDVNGDVISSSTEPTNENTRDQIFLGVLVHITDPTTNPNGFLTTINNSQMPANYAANQVRDILEGFGFINVTGNLLSTTGSGLTFQKSDGYMLGDGINYFNNTKDPHTLNLPPIDTSTTGTFQYSDRYGNRSALTLTELTPNVYDQGITVAYPDNLVAVGGPKWAAHRVFSFTSNALKIQYAQFIYNSEAEARGGIQTETYIIEPSFAENGLLIGYIVLRGGAADLSLDGDVKFLAAGKFGSASSTVSGSVSTLQNAYNNSGINPEILTNGVNGALTLKQGSGANTDNVLEVENDIGTITARIDGNGLIVGSSLDVSGNILVGGTVDGRDVATDGTKLDTIETNAKDDQLASEVPYTNTTSGLTATNVQVAIDEVEGRVDANDAKVSNVTTNLSVINKTGTTLDIASSDGTDATIPASTITEAGLMTASDKTKLDTIETNAKDDQNASEVPYTNTTSGLAATNVQTAIDEVEGRVDANDSKVSNVTTNLSEGTVTNTTVDVNSSDGTNATLLEASTLRAGVLSKAKFDEIVVNNAKVSNVTTNLSEGTVTNTTVDVNSSDGTNATLLEASTLRAGVLSKAKFDEIVANTAKAGLTDGDKGDITVSASGTVWTIDNDAVTYAKMQNVVADDRILGNVSGAGGIVAELTAAQVRTMINVESGAEPKPELTKGFYIEDPVATDDIGIWEPGVAITITKVVFRNIGGTSVTFNINHSGGTDLWAADEVSSTARESNTSFTDATCTADNYIRYQASAQSGDPTAFEMSITYTED
jgi:hypothetical protein